MKGINRAKHLQLIDALNQLKDLQQDKGLSSDDTLSFISDLEGMFKKYNSLLISLSIHIAEYEDRYNDIKVHHLSRKLRELKKDTAERAGKLQMSETEQAFPFADRGG